jgi:hypothetical protein
MCTFGGINMIRYSIVAITTFLNIIQYLYEYNGIEKSIRPIITKLNITTGAMLILTLLITKLISGLFHMRNPECKKYDDGKPVLGASALADFISFAICSVMVRIFLP